MARIKIDKDRCKGCGLCILYCPNKLISSSGTLSKKGLYVVRFIDKSQKCIGCSMCAIMCPDCAIEVWQ